MGLLNLNPLTVSEIHTQQGLIWLFNLIVIYFLNPCSRSVTCRKYELVKTNLQSVCKEEAKLAKCKSPLHNNLDVERNLPHGLHRYVSTSSLLEGKSRSTKRSVL